MICFQQNTHSQKPRNSINLILVKPFVRGRILFTPNTKVTQNLMKIVNEAFTPIENLRNFTKAYVNTYSKRVRNLLLNRDTQELLKDILIRNGTDSIFDTLSNSTLGKTFYSFLLLLIIDFIYFLKVSDFFS